MFVSNVNENFLYSNKNNLIETISPYTIENYRYENI